MPQYKATIKKIIVETPDTKTFVLEISPVINFIPGQFLTLLVQHDSKLHRRPYSIASVPGERDVSITIKLYERGVITPVLFRMQEGASLDVIGPYGRFTFEDKEHHAVFIGAGSGIVPLMSMIRTCVARKSSHRMTLLYSNKTADDIIYRDELDGLRASRKINYIPTLTRDNRDDHKMGRIDKEFLSHHLTDIASGFYYICGAPVFVHDVVAALVALGVPKERIKREEYD